MDFQFGKSGSRNRDDDFAEDTLVDSLIASAGGAPLPGKFGLVQALLGVWSREREGHIAFHLALQGLDTAGIILAYRKEERRKKEGEKKPEPPSKKYLLDHNLVPIPHLDQLSDFILRHLSDVPKEIRTIGEKNYTETISTFDLGNGLVCVYIFDNEEKAYKGYAQERSDWGSWQTIAEGPFVFKDKITESIHLLGEKVWAKNDYRDLEISYASNAWEEGSYRLGVLPDAEQYIDDPDSKEIGRSSKILADRCRLFQNKGRSRKILFYGPPGTGKTSIARQLAADIGCGRGMRIDPKVIKQANSRSLLQLLDLLQPSVLMMDDLDRTRSDSEALLHYLERLKGVSTMDERGSWAGKLIVTGTVNTIKTLDPALLRPGRFDEVQYVGPPGLGHRRALLRHFKGVFKLEAYPKTVDKMAREVNGFTPVEIRSLVDSLSAIGLEVYEVEKTRIRRQQKLYTQDKIDEYFDVGDSKDAAETPTSADSDFP